MCYFRRVYQTGCPSYDSVPMKELSGSKRLVTPGLDIGSRSLREVEEVGLACFLEQMILPERFEDIRKAPSSYRKAKASGRTLRYTRRERWDRVGWG